MTTHPNAAVLAEVAVCIPVDQTFTYAIPKGFGQSVRLGQRVLVPFGSRKLTGHVVDLPHEESSNVSRRLKDVLEVLDPEPIFDAQMLTFLKWVADYYHAPVGEVLATATPSGINLKSLRQVSLTEAGQKRFDPHYIDTPEEHVLKILDEKGTVKATSLLRFPAVKEHHLKALEKAGLVRIDSRLDKVRVKPLLEKVVRRLASDETIVHLKGNKQKVLWQHLADHGEQSVSSLEKEFKNVRSPLQALVQKGLIAIDEREKTRDPIAAFLDSTKPSEKKFIQLNPDQSQALSSISESLTEATFQTFLLHGVTGSGKTEVYLRAAEKALSLGRDVIVLVPEISLTTQMLRRFLERFGEKIAVIHSGLSGGERYDQWRRILKSEVKLVIGARSAIFAPFANLGLVIVDEEHDGAYKQETGVFYQGRDLAVARASLSKGVCILGSATPSIETHYKAQSGKYKLLTLPERVGPQDLPEVRMIDMSQAALLYRTSSQSPDEPGERDRLPIFSKPLMDAIQNTLGRGEQVVLFLNRRGFAPFLICKSCGEAPRCPHCAISLTYYQKRQVLCCHYCDYTEPLRKDCPHCSEATLLQRGVGTESVEDEIRAFLPQAKLVRMDRETTSRKGAHRKILDQIHEGEADILIGTQMVAKGHHFERVTLVGVINADTALHMPDFRAGERTFQLLTQVAGRAGRENLKGEVLIQTLQPNHFSLSAAKEHDYLGFYESEIALRQALSYPPFSRMVCFRLSAEKESDVLQGVEILRRQLSRLQNSDPRYQVLAILGPSPAPLGRLRGQWRWQMLIKSADAQALHRFTFQLRKVLNQDKSLKSVKIQVDVDPSNLL